jgi:hypothetical protein
MIGASLHRKVLSEGNVGHDIAVGCVIVLTKVVEQLEFLLFVVKLIYCGD